MRRSSVIALVVTATAALVGLERLTREPTSESAAVSEPPASPASSRSEELDIDPSADDQRLLVDSTPPAAEERTQQGPLNLDSPRGPGEIWHYTGNRIRLPGDHIPPDASLFEQKYGDLETPALQVALRQRVQELHEASSGAYAAERSGGHEQLLSTPFLEDPGSQDHGARIVTNPYADRLVRVRGLPGEPDVMGITLLEPARHPDLYDMRAECNWLALELHRRGVQPTLGGGW